MLGLDAAGLLVLIPPVKVERGLAEGEAVEVPLNSAFQAVELLRRTCIDANLEQFSLGIETDKPIARVIGAACVLGKNHLTMFGVEFDRKIMCPMLA